MLKPCCESPRSRRYKHIRYLQSALPIRRRGADTGGQPLCQYQNHSVYLVSRLELDVQSVSSLARFPYL